MRARARIGISRIALAAALVVVVAIAGVGAYFALTPSASSTTTRLSSTASTSAVTPPVVTVAAVPPSPWIAPGQTQNYSSLQVSAAGPGSGTVDVRAFPPAGLSLVLNQTSVPVSESSQQIPFVLKAASGLSTGNYSVIIETSSSTGPSRNQTLNVQVVPMLVIMQDLAFHPANITVAKGTRVTWLNLDSTIGCCDPGYHNVSFTTGANATSPTLSRFQSWTHAFGATGVVDYYCTIHPAFMKGQVTVTG